MATKSVDPTDTVSYEYEYEHEHEYEYEHEHEYEYEYEYEHEHEYEYEYEHEYEHEHESESESEYGSGQGNTHHTDNAMMSEPATKPCFAIIPSSKVGRIEKVFLNREARKADTGSITAYSMIDRASIARPRIGMHLTGATQE